MKMNLDIRMYELRKDLLLVTNAFEKNDFRAVKEKGLALRAKADKQGIQSCFLAWMVAVACDNMGEMKLAFDMICEASRLDPFDRNVQHSFDLIVDQIRGMLTNEDRDLADPTTPQIYEQLLHAGVADLGSHLAMARHLAHTGKLKEALAIAESTTLLYPVSRDAWKVKAGIAAQLGDAELVAACEAGAALAGKGDKLEDC